MDVANSLTVLPFHVIETSRGFVLTRGVAKVLITGKNGRAIIDKLSASIGSEITPDNFGSSLPPELVEESKSVLEALVLRRFLHPIGNGVTGKELTEDNLDVFLWQFDSNSQAITTIIKELNGVFVGVNQLTNRMIDAFMDQGINAFDVVDDEHLRNQMPSRDNGKGDKTEFRLRELDLQQTEDLPGLVVASSEFGSPSLLLKWNRYCIDHGIPFLPVYLHDMIGYVGPLVFPAETACLQCLRERQNAHLVDAPFERSIDDAMHSGASLAAIHPSMVKVIAETAVFQLVRYFSNMSSRIAGSLIKIDLLSCSTTVEKVLRMPRCPACGSAREHPTTKLST